MSALRRMASVVVAVAAAATLTASASASSHLPSNRSNEVTVLTNLGISPSRALQSLGLQDAVAATHLVSRIEGALASRYAGVWFEPSAAKFHVGVTSGASARTARRVAGQAGLSASVVTTPVRSTWAALAAAQERWNGRLAALIDRGDAGTGIDVQGNAVAITLSTSIAPAERAALQRKADAASVNTFIRVIPPTPPHSATEAACKAPFVAEKAYCEKTIVSGVGVAPGTTEPECTAGPMLIQGNETFMLTAGHCFGGLAPTTGETITVKVTSEYPTGGGQKEIGKEGTRFRDENRDTAEVKVARPGSFSEALPDPVPALMAEWSVKPAIPHGVEGVKAAEVVVPAQVICHEGMKTGEQCGTVLLLNVAASGVLAKHLVETSACSEGGDSGGPYFFRTSTKEVLMMGTHVGKGTGDAAGCPQTGSSRTVIEPLLDIPGATGLAILSTFSGQSLLTTSNEMRPGSSKFKFTTSGKLVAKALSTQVLTTSAGKVECTGLSAAEGTSGSVSATELTITVQYTGCTAFGLAATVSPAQYTLTSSGFVSLQSTVTIKATGCSVTVPSAKNKSLKLARYDNIPQQILVLPTVRGITSSGTGAACTYAEESEGLLEGRADIGIQGGTLEWT
jgi:hypothetical protein